MCDNKELSCIRDIAIDNAFLKFCVYFFDPVEKIDAVTKSDIRPISIFFYSAILCFLLKSFYDEKYRMAQLGARTGRKTPLYFSPA